MTEKNELGDFIRKWRGNHSIREVANLAGISHSYWSDLERGYSRATGKPVKPSLLILAKVAVVLERLNSEFMKDDQLDLLSEIIDLSDHSSEKEKVKIQENDQYNFLKSSDENSSSLEVDTFKYPINDIGFHLTEDNLNKKFYHGVPLTRTQLYNLSSIFDLFLSSTKRLSFETENKLISLVGKRDIEELETIYNILKFAYINKDEIASFNDIVTHTLLREFNIKSINLYHAYDIAYELFNDSKD